MGDGVALYLGTNIMMPTIYFQTVPQGEKKGLQLTISESMWKLYDLFTLKFLQLFCIFEIFQNVNLEVMDR